MDAEIAKALKVKSRPKFGSKRWWLLYQAGGSGVHTCDVCGAVLHSPQSILIHKGKVCENKSHL